MMPRMLATIGLLPVFATVAAAQPANVGESELPPLLQEDREIALALSAGPAHVVGGAAVYVLRRGGFEPVREGSNGYSCLVERDHPASLAPVCYDAIGREWSDQRPDDSARSRTPR